MLAICVECGSQLARKDSIVYCTACHRVHVYKHDYNGDGEWNKKVCPYCAHFMRYDPAMNRSYCPNCLVRKSNSANDNNDMDNIDGDNVDQPDHYTRYPMEVIDMVRLVLNHLYGPDGFEAYCFGTELVYQLRAGKKSDALEDIKKSLKYEQFRLESR